MSKTSVTGELVPLRDRSSGVNRPLTVRLKKRGGVEPSVGVETDAGDCRDDAAELLRYKDVDRGSGTRGDGGAPGKRGEVARGVLEGVWSSESKVESRGVIGLGMPGI